MSEPSSADRLARALLKAKNYIWGYTGGRTPYQTLNSDWALICKTLDEECVFTYGHRVGDCKWTGTQLEESWCPKCKYSVDILDVKAKKG